MGNRGGRTPTREISFITVDPWQLPFHDPQNCGVLIPCLHEQKCKFTVIFLAVFLLPSLIKWNIGFDSILKQTKPNSLPRHFTGGERDKRRKLNRENVMRTVCVCCLFVFKTNYILFENLFSVWNISITGKLQRDLTMRYSCLLN